MKTLVFIEGGMSFGTYDEYLAWLKKDYTEWCNKTWSPEPQKKWKHHLASRWIDNNGIVYIPEMPCDLDAKYVEWKIVFESIIDRITSGERITLIGHSLGGNFLLKYFGEIGRYDGNPHVETQEKINLLFIDEIHLVAACISEGDFTTPESYDTLRSLGSKVHIWHAEDDTLVPFATAKQLEIELPRAQTHFFGIERGYGHFFPLAVFGEFEDVVLQK